MENESLFVKGNIYVDLDSIFDTRISVLSFLDKNVALEMLDSKYYDIRLYDEFSYINNKLFYRFYNKRNNNVLNYSYITEIIDMVAVEASILVGNRIESGVGGDIKVIINKHPYKISEEDEKRIINAVNFYIDSDRVNIEIIDKSKYDITLSYVDNTFSTMFMYDGNDWLEYQMANIPTSASLTKLYVPALIKNPTIFSKKEDLETVFESRDKVYEPFINMTTLPTKLFNIKNNFKTVLKDRLHKRN